MLFRRLITCLFLDEEVLRGAKLFDAMVTLFVPTRHRYVTSVSYDLSVPFWVDPYIVRVSLPLAFDFI